MKHAIILLAHGSRDPLWRQPVEAVASQIRTRDAQALVECAYLELCAPTFAEAASKLISSGALAVTVFPLFLGLGKHAREDLPNLINAKRAAHPTVEWRLLPAAGELPQLTSLLADIALSY